MPSQQTAAARTHSNQTATDFSIHQDTCTGTLCTSLSTNRPETFSSSYVDGQRATSVACQRAKFPSTSHPKLLLRLLTSNRKDNRLVPTLPAAHGEKPRRTLTLASDRAINSMKMNGGAATDTKLFLPSAFSSSVNNPAMVQAQTIRTVPSFEVEGVSDTSSDTTPSIATKNSAFSSSVNSNASGISMSTQQEEKTPSVRLKFDKHNSDTTITRSRGGEVNGNATALPNGLVPALHNTDAATEEHAVGGGSSATDVHGQGWDSSVGKAGLGKTGRVINKLVSDNEALKRDIQIERLRAEESKQAAKLVEDKMERLISDYESRLLEANVTKTLLSRKERQVESLTATVELERKRTQDAQERERSWRDEMEKMRTATTSQVEEANTYAQMMEGRYTAISSHWRDQGDEVKRVVAKMKGEISSLTQERRKDDEKIQTLRELCDQQDGNIRELRRQKVEIGQAFEDYKAQQEVMLEGIKIGADEREREQERLLGETREVLNKLKWALNVRENVRGAQ
jgi:hypothetical protein